MAAQGASASQLRTWVGVLKLPDAPADLLAMPRGADRKVAAWQWFAGAERAARRSIEGQLAALRSEGVLAGWEFVPNTGAVVLNAPEAVATAAWQAIRGIEGLGTIVRGKSIEEVRNAGGAVPPGTDTNHRGKVIQADPVTEKQRPAWQVHAIGADKLWQQGIDGRGVTIGFVDSGADVTHRAIASHYRGFREGGRFDDNYNFYDATGTSDSIHDGWGHGTNTASVAVGGTKAFQTGVAPGAKFISARVFGEGKGSILTKLKGLGWMLAPTDKTGRNADARYAPDIVNMSFGSGDGEHLVLHPVMKAYEAAGIIPVAAAGNGGRRGEGTVIEPASFKEVIGVGFTDKRGRVSPRSAQGPVKGVPGGVTPKPDFVAPGDNVVAALKDGGYSLLSGSSLSSAITSGAIALLLSKYPDLTMTQIRQALSSTAHDLGEPGRDYRTGYGSIDIDAAFAMAGRIKAGEHAAGQ